MNKKWIRISFIAAFMLVMLFALPTIGHAANSGSTGNVRWSCYGGELYIYGTGAMGNYSYSSETPWYSHRQNITKITVGEGVTSIGNHAFDFLYNATTLTLPQNSLTSIGRGAFQNCSRLSGTLVLPDSVISIGAGAFWGTDNLYIRDSGTTGDVSWSLEYGTLTISGTGAMADYLNLDAPWEGYINGEMDEIIIGEGVTHVGDYAFWTSGYNDTVTSVSLPSTLKSIGHRAFCELGEITSISIPGSVTSVSAYAFEECEGLTSVTLGNGMTQIGESMFSLCTSLTQITLPSTIESIGENAFYKCSNLASINFPSSLKYIDSHAFYYTNLSSISLPSGLQHIGDYAFFGCPLNSVTLPAGIKSIGYWAFSSTDTSGNPLILNASGTTGNLSWRVNGETLTITGSGAMPDYKTGSASRNHAPWHGMSGQITTVVLDSRITSIGNSAFYNMSKVTGFNLPSGLKSIGASAFSYTAITEISLPDGLEYIGVDAFRYCSGLTTIAVPDSVTSVGGKIVDDSCTVTSGLWISGHVGTLNWDIKGSTLTVSGSGAMKSFDHEVSSKYNIDTVDTPWWAYRLKITDVVIGEGITKVGNAAFYKCSYLTSVSLPSTLTEIDDEAFRNTALKTLTLPDSVHTIGLNAFSGTQVTSVNIPRSMTTVQGFGGMYRLQEVIVPSGANILALGQNAFYGCTQLQAFDIPETVTSIPYAAFYNCSSLMEINIPSGVTSIGDYAFYGCSGFTEIDLPAVVNDIGMYAFYNCTGLTEFVIPSAVTAIDSYTFNGCTGLESIVIHDNISSVGKYAFQKCTGLKNIIFEGTAPATIDTTAFTGVTANATYTPNSSWTGKILNYGGKITWLKVSGSCGSDVSWRLEDETTLRIFGAGTISEASWTDYTAAVTKLQIAADVAGIQSNLVNTLPALTEIHFEGDMPALANGAFNGVSAAAYYPHGKPGWTGENRVGYGGSITWVLYCDGTGTYNPNAVEMIALDPTCTEDGYIAHWLCDACAEVPFTGEELLEIIPREELVLPATGHSYGAAEFAWAEDGGACSASFTCASCGDVQTVTAEVAGEITAEPSCTEPGTTAYTATATFEEAEYVDTITLYDIPATGHTEVWTEGFAPSCTEPGLTDECFCETCGETLQELEEIPALGHTDIISIEALEPTCAEDGYTAEHRCGVCDELLIASEVVPATGNHTDSITIEALEPTCTADGHTAEHRCSVCDGLLIASEVIPATGHSYGEAEFAWAEDGSACTAAFTCIHQDDTQTLTAEITAAEAVPATCTEPGDTLYTASVVFEEKEYQSTLQLTDIPALGHEEVSDARVEPTNRETGLTEGSHCGRCGEVLVAQQVIPALFTYDGDTITAYNGESVYVQIPEDATALSSTLFKNNTAIESVRVPENITSVGTQTFYGCTSLQDIWLPDAVTGVVAQTFHKVTARIHADAGSATAVLLSFRSIPFYVEEGYTLRYRVTSATGTPGGVWIVGCDLNREKLVLPTEFAGTAVTQIQSGAFANLPALRRLQIPASVTAIAADAFSGCENLTLVVAENSYAHTWCLDNNAAYEFIPAPILPGEDAWTLPANLRAIEDEAFINLSAAEIIIPDGVVSIGSRAFAGCADLTYVFLPDSVTEIAADAFEGCEHVSFVCTSQNAAAAFADENNIAYVIN